jgi:hypothetical protein
MPFIQVTYLPVLQLQCRHASADQQWVGVLVTGDQPQHPLIVLRLEGIGRRLEERLGRHLALSEGLAAASTYTT